VKPRRKGEGAVQGPLLQEPDSVVCTISVPIEPGMYQLAFTFGSKGARARQRAGGVGPEVGGGGVERWTLDVEREQGTASSLSVVLCIIFTSHLTSTLP